MILKSGSALVSYALWFVLNHSPVASLIGEDLQERLQRRAIRMFGFLLDFGLA